MARSGIAALVLLVAACGRDERRIGPVAGEPGRSPGTGTLEIQVRDALTGKPIERCNVVGWQSGDQMAEMTPAQDDVASDGLHRFELQPLTGRVRLAAPGYSETWSEELKLTAGETKHVTVSMKPLSRLVVTVIETDGSPVKEGTLLLTGHDRESTMLVKDGVADGQEDAGSVLVVVDPQFMKGFVPQQKPVTLVPGQRTEVRLQVARP